MIQTVQSASTVSGHHCRGMEIVQTLYKNWFLPNLGWLKSTGQQPKPQWVNDEVKEFLSLARFKETKVLLFPASFSFFEI